MLAVQKMKFSYLTLNLLLVFTLSLISINFASAEEFEDINPRAGSDFVILLTGQSATFTTSATTPVDVYALGVLSIANRGLTARLNIIGGKEASGVWWISAIGNGYVRFFDFAIGIIPYSGNSVQIIIDENVGYALVTAGVFLTSPVSAEEPLQYSITVR